jgi:ribosomal protein S18 acetylase RimI-like enzyme
MTTDDPQHAIIRPITPEDEDQALALLVARAVPEDRAMRLETMRADLQGGDSASATLLGAYRGRRLVGAVFSQLQAGRSGVVGLPGTFSDEPPATPRTLLGTAAERLAGEGARLVYAILEQETEAEVDLLRQTGFKHLAHLLYLVAPESEFPRVRPESPLDFEPYSPASHQRLARVMEATYQQTMDCPGLETVRSTDDVLAGYRQMGVFDPSRWLIVRHAGGDVGCLLLTDHPRHQNLELVYMGVVPAARGKQWGYQIARHAQWVAHQVGRRRVVLAVDQSNAPALKMYRQAGFAAWERRSVWAKCPPFLSLNAAKISGRPSADW